MVATAVGLMAWIVLWAVNFGRSGDAFFVTVLPVLFLTAAFRIATRRSRGPRD